MTRAPDWTLDEFETPIEHPEMDDAALAVLLFGRSIDAVRVIRLGIHARHQGQSVSMLSQVMLERLERGGVTCSICRMRF